MACGNSGDVKPKGKKLEVLEWADINVVGSRMLGDSDTIAQVGDCP